MKRALAIVMLGACALPAHSQRLSDAFTQGSALGRSGNAFARSLITPGATQSVVPGYTPNPAEASYFGSPGLGSAASGRIAECAARSSALGGSDEQACNAVEFSQTNPSRHPTYTIGPSDPLLTRSRSITADPQAIAGNIAGTYTGCTVQTVTQPDIFETAICHQHRTMETSTCDKVLIVTAGQTPGCSPGQFLTRVTADPCPACIDYLVYDFTCGSNNYLMHVFTIEKGTSSVYMDMGSLYVPGTLNTEIGMTPGPAAFDGFFCYQTYYSQSCSGPNCSIGAWFQNPCQGTSYYGVNTFAMPTTVSFTDSWDNQCATFEARAQ